MWSQSVETLNPYEALMGEKKEKTQTNADILRAMIDDELADFLSNWGGCNKCKFRDTCTSSIGSVSKICKEIHLEWLKQPAE